ncbi:hypothetical protein [Alteromonas sp. 4B03]|uniref:hypothetical protein n=1 Tax=Alteromonas sp. 4B03 TaxID=2603817 RepID=UPI003D2A267F
MLNKLIEAFPANQSFFSLSIVKKTVLIIFSIFFVSITVITINFYYRFGYSIEFSFEGFNNLFLVYKFPIAVLALLIPMLALYATNHRSEQMNENMRLLSSQNNFTNFHKHIELFGKHLENNQYKDISCNHVSLHKKAFPRDINGTPTFSVTETFEENLALSFNKINELLHSLASNERYQLIETFIQASQMLRYVENSLSCSIERQNESWTLEQDGVSAKLFGNGDLRSLLFAAKKLASFSLHVLDFSEQKHTSIGVKDIIDIEPKNAPFDFSYENLCDKESNITPYIFPRQRQIKR